MKPSMLEIVFAVGGTALVAYLAGRAASPNAEDEPPAPAPTPIPTAPAPRVEGLHEIIATEDAITVVTPFRAGVGPVWQLRRKRPISLYGEGFDTPLGHGTFDRLFVVRSTHPQWTERLLRPHAAGLCSEHDGLEPALVSDGVRLEVTMKRSRLKASVDDGDGTPRYAEELNSTPDLQSPHRTSAARIGGPPPADTRQPGHGTLVARRPYVRASAPSRRVHSAGTPS